MAQRKVVKDEWGNPLIPLSVKAIVVEKGEIWLRLNEFGRWELPGGRLEENEQPEQTIVREVAEELGLEVTVLHLIDVVVWKKDFGLNPMITIVTFECRVVKRIGDVEHHGEAGKTEFKKVPLESIEAIVNLPDIYKYAIRKYLLLRC